MDKLDEKVENSAKECPYKYNKMDMLKLESTIYKIQNLSDGFNR